MPNTQDRAIELIKQIEKSKKVKPVIEALGVLHIHTEIWECFPAASCKLQNHPLRMPLQRPPQQLLRPSDLYSFRWKTWSVLFFVRRSKDRSQGSRSVPKMGEEKGGRKLEDLGMD